MPHQIILVFLCHLLGSSPRVVIKLIEDIFLCNGRGYTFSHKQSIEITSKRFGLGEKHTSIAYCIALYIVEIAITVGTIIIIKAVSPKQFDYRLLLNLLLWDIT